ncbi:MAG: hypothetical protein Q8R28_09820 [Dehalococcoidia bacterium]|nr:hypothetical protein [Dehalococcoidia bacterium]
MATVICWRSGGDHYVPPGSAARNCYRCGAAVTIAPSTQNLVRGKEEGYRFVCQICILTLPPGKIKMIPGWEKEVYAARRRQ